MDYADALNSKFKQLLENVNKHGISFVKQTPNDLDSFKKLVNKFGCIQETFYGAFWDVKNNPEAKNIAYTNLQLGLHMDLLYFTFYVTHLDILIL